VLPARSVTEVDVRFKPGSRRVVRVPPPVDMLPRTRPPSTRPRRLLAATGIVATLGAAAGVVVGEPWSGPVLLSLSTGHGIHAGNLAAIPLVALAFCIGRRGSRGLRPVGQPIRRALSRRWVGPAAALVLGALLLTPAIVDLPHRGSMVPSGGGTIDGAVLFVAGRSASPIGVWSYVALTYDGSKMRLFVDGRQAASRPTTGTIATARNPLWFGGNHPFGEFFDGLIDEARVYDRALTEAEIRADMRIPVATGGAARGRANVVAGSRGARPPAVGLVAAYAFDEGAGASVADGSGHGNVGAVSGATWTRGRYGNALSFDGADDIVRVPPSTSLDVGSEVTLSAWVRPAASQGGWRTIIYRERDIFFLDAGSDIQGRVGRVDDLLAGSVVAAAAVFSVVMAATRGRWLGRRRRAWPAAAGMILVGCVVDAVFAPSVTLFGPTLLAVWFAVSAEDGGEAAVGWLVTCALTLVTAASLTDLAGIESRLQRDDGGLARSAALGVTLVAIGLVMLRRDPPSRRKRAAASPAR
jgi:Concanavalin A-like lectin/glucanases superfamily